MKFKWRFMDLQFGIIELSKRGARRNVKEKNYKGNKKRPLGLDLICTMQSQKTMPDKPYLHSLC